MDLTLTTTWNLRGELPRLQRLLPRMQEVYNYILAVIPPESIIGEAGMEQVMTIKKLGGLQVCQTSNWSEGRYIALQRSLAAACTHIQYADMDRILRWVETRPDEWRHAAEMVTRCDCLIIGRSPAAYRTHPQALTQTEAISNRVVSHFLGRSMDVSAGSKGFSREAAEYLVANTIPSRALGTDAEWPILLHRAGFHLDYIEVDGLDWESADRYREKAADAHSQRALAEAYDADPQHWASRVEVAMEIVDMAVETISRSMDESSDSKPIR